MQIERLLQVEEQPFDRPAQAGAREGLVGRQPTRVQDVGQQVQAAILAPVANQSQGALGLSDPAAHFHELVFQETAAALLPGEHLETLDGESTMPAEQAIQLEVGQVVEILNRGLEPIAQQQCARR